MAAEYGDPNKRAMARGLSAAEGIMSRRQQQYRSTLGSICGSS
jgi:hypothetical protein